MCKRTKGHLPRLPNVQDTPGDKHTHTHTHTQRGSVYLVFEQLLVVFAIFTSQVFDFNLGFQVCVLMLHDGNLLPKAFQFGFLVGRKPMATCAPNIRL